MNTKNHMMFVLLVAFLLAGMGLATNVFSDNSRTAGTRAALMANDKDIVYTMGTGTKYHRAGCRYLKNKKVKMTKAAARKAGFTACKVCKP